MSTLTRTEWQDCAVTARLHRDRLYEFRMWDKGYLCGVESHTAPGATGDHLFRADRDDLRAS